MSTDRRTKYTKSVIREALFDLLKEKPLAKVTVTDICKLADINRSTFYSYYEDVNSLMNQIQNDVFQDILFSLTTDNWFNDLIQLVDKNKDLFSILIGPHGDTGFIRQLLYLGYDNTMKMWSETYPKASAEDMDYAYAFIAYGMIGILENWVMSEYALDTKAIGRIVYGLSMYGISFLTEDKPERPDSV